jgi:hypothetical protein
MARMIHLVGAGILAAGLGIGALPVMGADGTAGIPSLAAFKPKEFGGKMPLPVDQRLERQNSTADKLVVEVSHSVKEGTQYVAYVKVVWGDLDNLIKGTGKQYYSNWDGALALTGATGAIDQKIQFDDGKPAATTKATTTRKAVEGPREGSGRDEVDVAAGATVKWEAGVVGVLDGLRIKITSPVPVIHGTLKAGHFTIPLVINPDVTLSTAAPKPAPSGRTGQSFRMKPVEPKPSKAPANSGTGGTIQLLIPSRS